MNDYPCKDCIVKGICSEICSKLRRKVHSFMLREKVCRDCGHDKYYEYKSFIYYYFICTECMSMFYIDGNKGVNKGSIHRSMESKTTVNDAFKCEPEYSLDGCFTRWKDWGIDS